LRNYGADIWTPDEMMEVIRGMSCKPTCEELTYVPDFDAYFGNTDLSDPVSEGIKNTTKENYQIKIALDIQCTFDIDYPYEHDISADP
jgi:hypothetical protein